MDDMLLMLNKFTSSPEGQKLAMRAIETAAPFAVEVVGDALGKRKDKKLLRHAFERLRSDAEIWHGERAVLIEPVCRHSDGDKARYDEHGGHEVKFGLRTIVVATFPIQILRYVVKFLVHPFQRDFQVERPIKSDTYVENGKDHIEEFFVTGIEWPKFDPATMPADLRCVVPVDVWGNVLIRGPWEDADQEVEFRNTIWLPFYVYGAPSGNE